MATARRDLRAARRDIGVTEAQATKEASAANGTRVSGETVTNAPLSTVSGANPADVLQSDTTTLSSIGDTSLRGGLQTTSTPAQPSAAAQPGTPQHVAAQIAQVIQSSNQRSVELRLHPEELGRVSMTMSQDATGTMSVVLNVERPETLAMMRRNIDMLGQELQDMGYGSVDFSFQGGTAGQGRQNTQTDLSATDLSTMPEASGEVEAPLAPANAAIPVRGGLTGETIDIRL
jgi:flagellar hook-length control protein FliK